MAYNTGNPIGSLDPRDAADNKENFDRFAVSAARTYTDRLGVERKTVTGTLQDYAAYNLRGAWATATAYNVNDVWRDGPTGAFYLVLADYTSGATAAADIAGGNVAVHQPKDWVVSVATIADLCALEPAFDGQQASVIEYNSGTGVGGGLFYWDASRLKTDHNGGVVFSPTVPFSATASDYLDGIGETDVGGSGCWIRSDVYCINPVMFGQKGDFISDDYPYIRKAVDVMREYDIKRFEIGDAYYPSSMVFNFPDDSYAIFSGTIKTDTVNEAAITIGDPSSMTRNLRVIGIKVIRSNVDETYGSTGVNLRNLVFCNVSVEKVNHFGVAILSNGTHPNGGVSYNEFHLGYIHDNRDGIRLLASGGGYVNENTFYGGSFNHSSSYPTGLSTTHLHIPHNETHGHNNNRFMFPSFEDNSTIAIAAIINGYDNLVFHPRMENPAMITNYPFIFDNNSNWCEIIGSGNVIYSGSIIDNGFNNSFDCRDGKQTSRQGNTIPVQRYKGAYSGDVKYLSFDDPSGLEVAYIKANGTLSAYQIISEKGMEFDSIGTGIKVGTSSPEGLIEGRVGSIYVNKNGSTGSTLYVKETDATLTTGWVAK